MAGSGRRGLSDVQRREGEVPSRHSPGALMMLELLIPHVQHSPLGRSCGSAGKRMVMPSMSCPWTVILTASL